MKLFSRSSARRRRPMCYGMTIVELLVSIASGSVVLGAMLTTGTATSNTIAAISNYNDLNKTSRNTLDTMTRDLRNTAVVTALNSNLLTVSNTISGAIISYRWDSNEKLSRIQNGTSTVMLTGCDELAFSGFQRHPTNNLEFITTSDISRIKLISVSWRCYRHILGAKINTESVQTAQICIRN